jgi:hypothetical protein
MQFVLVFHRLQHVTLNPEMEDKLLWRWDSSGTYNAASAYKAMFLGQSSILGDKEIWKTKAPSKCRFFAWLVLLRRNWTSEHLWHHGLRDDATCALCSQEPETVDHLLVQCMFSREVWFKSFRRCVWQHLVPSPQAHMVEW